MDKQKEIEKMAYSICPMPQASEYITDCTKCGSNGDCLRQKHAKKFIDKGYGDIKAAAKEAVTDRTEEIFSWLYNNLVNANFVTGNAEISMWGLQNKAAEYGIDFINNEGRRIEEEAEND